MIYRHPKMKTVGSLIIEGFVGRHRHALEVVRGVKIGEGHCEWLGIIPSKQARSRCAVGVAEAGWMYVAYVAGGAMWLCSLQAGIPNGWADSCLRFNSYDHAGL